KTEATVGAVCCARSSGRDAAAGRAPTAAPLDPALTPSTGKINTANSRTTRVRFIAVSLLNCLVVFAIRAPFIYGSPAPIGHSGATPSAINKRLVAALSRNGLIAA